MTGCFRIGGLTKLYVMLGAVLLYIVYNVHKHSFKKSFNSLCSIKKAGSMKKEVSYSVYSPSYHGPYNSRLEITLIANRLKSTSSKKENLSRATSASAVCAFNDPPHLELAFGDSADAVCSKVGVSGLNTTKTAQIFITLLLPLSNQILVSVSLPYAIIIELSTYRLSLVE